MSNITIYFSPPGECVNFDCLIFLKCRQKLFIEIYMYTVQIKISHFLNHFLYTFISKLKRYSFISPLENMNSTNKEKLLDVPSLSQLNEILSLLYYVNEIKFTKFCLKRKFNYFSLAEHTFK